jgi:mono/diheme cytochrome c family protein
MSNRWKVIRALALLVGVVVAVLGLNALGTFLEPPLPPAQPVRQARWLEQGWSASERHWFHHATQGTSSVPIPYAWFVALAEPRISPFGPERLLSGDAYMQKLGFIPSPKTGAGDVARYGYAGPIQAGRLDARGEPLPSENPDGLPVGFAITRAYKDPTTQQMLPDQIGLTCAACHTGHLEYNGVSLRIDGANASTSLSDLTKAATAALLLTDVLPWRFKTFADRVLGPQATKAQRKALHAELKTTLKTLMGQAAATARIDKGNTEEGFNRLDALNRIGNAVFYTNLVAAKAPGFDPLTNYAPVDAPVKYPHLWNTPWFSWAQYDGSIEQPAIRNVGEALGVSARVNMTTFGDPARLWTSSVPVHNLGEMEQLIEGGNPQERLPDNRVRGFTGLMSPKWPQDVLGPLDPAKAAVGRRLYVDHCQRCHLPPVDDPNQALYAPALWTPANAYGESYLENHVIPQAVVGTDPGQARVLISRKITVPLALGVQPGVTDPKTGVTCFTTPTPARTQLVFGQALASAVQSVVDKFQVRKGLLTTAPQAIADKGNRPNCIQALVGYKARPLNGIWATPPYLHNGSVPSIQALLGPDPARDRPATFCLGNRPYDPKAVGLDVSSCPRGSFKVDTRTKGNANRGHEFRDGTIGQDGVIGRKLSPEERLALLEFLKSQ